MAAVVHFIVKYVLFLINLIFTLLGLGLVVIGVILHFQTQKTSNSDFDVEVPPLLNYFAIAIIVLGCVVFLIAFSGCCGAVTETKCLLIMFAAITVLLIATQVYLLIVWNNAINTARYKLEEELEELFDVPTYNGTFHAIEALFECCGTTGPDVYEILPPTCCGITDIDFENWETIEKCKIEDAFSVGCIDLIDKRVASLGNIARTVLISIIVFEGLEFIGAVYLCTSINKRRNKRRNTHY